MIIDFTIPKCTLEILKIASKLKKRIVIGTTGFTQNEERTIKKYSKNKNYDNNFTHLYPNRIDVDTHNISKLNDLEGKIDRHFAILVKKKN